MTAEILLSLISLIAMELVLGIDNIIFISILAEKLPQEQRGKLRILGITIAMVLRLILLLAIVWIMKLDTSLFSIGSIPITGKGLVLLLGGLFLIYKSCKELIHKAKNHEETQKETKANTFRSLLIQVLILDLVFSIDSIITAVGMVEEIWIMYVAVIVTVLIMLFLANPISNFIHKYPNFKIMAICFLLLIGVTLVLEGFNIKVPKAYIYSAMGFSIFVDMIQIKTLRKG